MKLFLVLSFCALAPALSGQTRYSNPKNGVSFRYPKGYVLKEGDLAKDDKGLGYLGPIPMQFAAPGGVRVATVEAPEKSYPGTDFTNAFFTVSENQRLSADQCLKFSDDVAGSQKFLVKTISGIEFRGLELGSAAMNHQFGGVFYHGFANGVCYELGYGIATSGYGAIDGIKPVNEKKVFAILEQIFNSSAIKDQTMRSR